MSWNTLEPILLVMHEKVIVQVVFSSMKRIHAKMRALC